MFTDQQKQELWLETYKQTLLPLNKQTNIDEQILSAKKAAKSVIEALPDSMEGLIDTTTPIELTHVQQRLVDLATTAEKSEIVQTVLDGNMAVDNPRTAGAFTHRAALAETVSDFKVIHSVS